MVSTCSDLWSLVYDHDCSAVVVLCNPSPGVSNVSFDNFPAYITCPCVYCGVVCGVALCLFCVVCGLVWCGEFCGLCFESVGWFSGGVLSATWTC